MFFQHLEEIGLNKRVVLVAVSVAFAIGIWAFADERSSKIDVRQDVEGILANQEKGILVVTGYPLIDTKGFLQVIAHNPEAYVKAIGDGQGIDKTIYVYWEEKDLRTYTTSTRRVYYAIDSKRGIEYVYQDLYGKNSGESVITDRTNNHVTFQYRNTGTILLLSVIAMFVAIASIINMESKKSRASQP